jgi:hypothetical protein
MMTDERGSKKMIEDWRKRRMTTPEADVKKLLSLPANFKLHDIYWKGQPPMIDRLYAEVAVTPDHAADFLKEVIKFDGRYDIHILINGIPFPDILKFVLESHDPLQGPINATAVGPIGE